MDDFTILQIYPHIFIYTKSKNSGEVFNFAEKYYMEVFKQAIAITSTIENYKTRQNKSIGFVPTMGALHKGHLTLLNTALKQNDIVVVSIFVNPKQFNNKEDLKNYPRDIDADLKLLEKEGCHIAFCPSEDEVYPDNTQHTYNLGYLNETMEGKFREGHFNGVATVVHRLFNLIIPDKAYFGEKDYQQLMVIKKIVDDYKLPVEIIPCPTVRENDGLAMSSRNQLLSKKERELAVLIPQTLLKASKLTEKYSVDEMKHWVVSTINSNPLFNTEYFEIVDDNTLKPVSSWDDKPGIIGCLAANLGKVRLIDNVRFYL